jgi:hypothetical protein
MTGIPGSIIQVHIYLMRVAFKTCSHKILKTVLTKETKEALQPFDDVYQPFHLSSFNHSE